MRQCGFLKDRTGELSLLDWCPRTTTGHQQTSITGTPVLQHAEPQTWSAGDELPFTLTRQKSLTQRVLGFCGGRDSIRYNHRETFWLHEEGNSVASAVLPRRLVAARHVPFRFLQQQDVCTLRSYGHSTTRISLPREIVPEEARSVGLSALDSLFDPLPGATPQAGICRAIVAGFSLGWLRWHSSHLVTE